MAFDIEMIKKVYVEMPAQAYSFYKQPVTI